MQINARSFCAVCILPLKCLSACGGGVTKDSHVSSAGKNIFIYLTHAINVPEESYIGSLTDLFEQAKTIRLCEMYRPGCDAWVPVIMWERSALFMTRVVRKIFTAQVISISAERRKVDLHVPVASCFVLSGMC